MINDSTCLIPILFNNSINPIFIRANSVILNTLSTECNDEDQYRQFLESSWVEKFNAVLIFENNIPKFIKFRSPAELIKFLMKW